MATRSLTHVKEEGLNSKTLVTMYRHYDGYLEGHGKDLATFLKGFRIVNGLSAKNENDKIANGMDCLAAQIVAHFKEGPGDIYLYSPDTSDVWEDYTYTVYMDKGKLKINIKEFKTDLGSFLPEELSLVI